MTITKKKKKKKKKKKRCFLQLSSDAMHTTQQTPKKQQCPWTTPLWVLRQKQARERERERESSSQMRPKEGINPKQLLEARLLGANKWHDTLTCASKEQSPPSLSLSLSLSVRIKKLQSKAYIFTTIEKNNHESSPIQLLACNIVACL